MFELTKSKEIIETQLGSECKHFVPPVGDFSVPRDKDLIKKQGTKASQLLLEEMTEEQRDIFYKKTPLDCWLE